MHIFLRKPTWVSCPKCSKPVLPHTVCQNCGYYKGVEFIDVLKKLTKKEKKKKEQEMKAKEAGERGAPSEGKEVAKEKSLSWEELSKK